MPAQSGSDAVLKKMFRGYTSDEYRVFVDQIRALKRPISITSDIIVGFCDETEEDFQKSLELSKYAMFDMIYIGIYSPRPGTYAARKYEDSIPLSIKKQRRAALNEVLKSCSEHNNLKELNQIHTVLIKSINEDGTLSGYTDHMKSILLSGKNTEGVEA
jgi:tRNA-2-methylthio-N6-dimethylallyladenosine synthase